MPVTIGRRELIAALGGAAAGAWSIAAHAGAETRGQKAECQDTRLLVDGS